MTVLCNVSHIILFPHTGQMWLSIILRLSRAALWTSLYVSISSDRRVRLLIPVSVALRFLLTSTAFSASVRTDDSFFVRAWASRESLMCFSKSFNKSILSAFLCSDREIYRSHKDIRS